MPDLSLAPSGTVPAGHRGPRGAILLHLKSNGSATAKHLAATFGYSLNAVRHHLKELEGEGVIGYGRVPSGVGAPAHTWHLTDHGHALFPDRYERTVADLLDHLVATQGRDAAVRLLEQQYQDLAARLEAETRDMPAADRGDVVARVMRAEGYMATWQHASAGGLLTEHHCPHRLIAERFPEICLAEERFLSEVFGQNVERLSRIAGGCGTCTYRIDLAEPASLVEEVAS
jgi:DeoR family suf operon transcriptional repressor